MVLLLLEQELLEGQVVVELIHLDLEVQVILLPQILLKVVLEEQVRVEHLLQEVVEVEQQLLEQMVNQELEVQEHRIIF